MQGSILLNDKREYPFKFSVVMAVYNVEPFLNEAVDSLLNQTIGFLENIQLILVDDGSKDNSGAICDSYKEQYPNNIIVIHKENGGVSSARNEGLKCVQGRYVNFLDSDDKLSADTLENVYQFFIEHENETDVVAIPMYFFDGQTGDHILNYKFKGGNQVIDLRKNYKNPQLSMPSAFFKNKTLKNIKFDINLMTAEDAKEMLKILLVKMTLGVVSNGKYFYRRRTQGELSAIQKSELNKNWYIPYLKNFTEAIIEHCNYEQGYIPKFIQYALMYDLQWKVKQKEIPLDVLSGKEEKEYYQLLFELISNFDDEIILQQKNLEIEYKTFLLRKKYNEFPTITVCNSQPLLHLNDTYITNLAYNKIIIEFIEQRNNNWVIEGYAVLIPYKEPLEAKIVIMVNDEPYEAERVVRNKDIVCDGETVLKSYGFKAEIPIEILKSQNEIEVYMQIDDILFKKKNLSWGRYSPISSKYENQYYYNNPWFVTSDRNTIYLNNIGNKLCVLPEYRYLRELLKTKEKSAFKAVLARIAYHFLSLVKLKPIWLLSDRIVKAGDNGEALFRYLLKHGNKKTEYYFILDESSTDYSQLESITSNIVKHFSAKHKLLYLLSDFIISSHADEITINPFGNYFDLYRDIMYSKKFIFLQHGITKDDISGWLNRYNKNIKGFITAAIPEHESIISNNAYGYSSEAIWLTGFPRHDRLQNTPKKIITIMPTWRKYLMQMTDTKIGYWDVTSEFLKSSFLSAYKALLNNKTLLDATEKYGYQIQFMPHPTLQPHIKLFKADSLVNLLGLEASYQKVFSESALVITDYSSAVFDFAYLRKPVLYYQFDEEEFFRNGHVYTKGYFDYEDSGFGEVCYDEETLVDMIIEYMEHDCKLKDKYRERIDNFFAYNDRNNCERVYKKIVELE